MPDTALNQQMDAIASQHDATEETMAALHAIGRAVKDRADALRWVSLLYHLVGQDQGQWDQVAAQMRAMAERLSLDRDGAIASRLAVAYYMINTVDDFLAAEADAVASASGQHASAVTIWIRLSCAEARIARDRAQVPQWLTPVLRLADTITESTPLDRSLASTTNNVASALLEADLTRPRVAEALELCARVSHRFWYRAGGWAEQERAEYLLALAHNALGNFEEGQAAARRGLTLIEQNGEERVDCAFLNVELARACKQLGQSEAHISAREKATELATEFQDEGLREWFDRVFARIS